MQPIIIFGSIVAVLIAYYAKANGLTTYDSFKAAVFPSSWLTQSLSNNIIKTWFSTKLSSADLTDQILGWTAIITLIVITIFVLIPIMDNNRRTNAVRGY